MGYPENVLAPGESVVLHTRPHYKAIIPAILLLWVGTLAAAALLGFVHQTELDGTAATSVTIAVVVLWAGVTAKWAVLSILQWRSTHFAITDRRVMYRVGLINRAGIDIPMARINSVEFAHGLWDRLWRTGTLVIESASDEPLELHNIPRVEQVHSQLYHEVFDDER